MQGHSLDAALEQIKAGFDRRMEQIDEQLRTDIHNNPAMREELNQEAERRRRAALDESEAEQGRARQAAFRADSDKQFKTRSDNQDSYINLLRLEAEAGNASKAILADRLELENKYFNVRKEILDAGREATDQEKASFAASASVCKRRGA